MCLRNKKKVSLVEHLLLTAHGIGPVPICDKCFSRDEDFLKEKIMSPFVVRSILAGTVKMPASYGTQQDNTDDTEDEDESSA
jgi:hypothetical protein